MPTPPVVETMLFCDNALIEERSRKTSLIGIFERIRAARFPHYQHCFLFLRLTGGSGETQCFVRITEVRTGEIRYNLPVAFNFVNPAGIMNWNLGLILQVSGPGCCRAEVVYAGEVLRSVALQVQDVSGENLFGPAHEDTGTGAASEGRAAGIPDGLPPEAASDPDWWKKPKA